MSWRKEVSRRQALAYLVALPFATTLASCSEPLDNVEAETDLEKKMKYMLLRREAIARNFGITNQQAVVLSQYLQLTESTDILPVFEEIKKPYVGPMADYSIASNLAYSAKISSTTPSDAINLYEGAKEKMFFGDDVAGDLASIAMARGKNVSEILQIVDILNKEIGEFYLTNDARLTLVSAMGYTSPQDVIDTYQEFTTSLLLPADSRATAILTLAKTVSGRSVDDIKGSLDIISNYKNNVFGIQNTALASLVLAANLGKFTEDEIIEMDNFSVSKAKLAMLDSVRMVLAMSAAGSGRHIVSRQSSYSSGKIIISTVLPIGLK